MDISERQIKILKAIIEEYIETAEAVSSELIEKKYGLGVSPATIRNEMAALVEGGYLKQPHTSAGRVPTPQGLKYYINNLMQKKNLSVVEEVSAREKVWDSRFYLDKTLREATKALAAKTRTLAVAATEAGEVYYSGTSNILDMPEFYDIDVTRQVLSLLDEYQRLCDLFFKRSYGEERVHVVMGEDLHWPFMDPVGFVFSSFKTANTSGSVGVIGPCRLNYSQIVPTVAYFGDLISEMGTSW